jgi:6-phosphofructokinase
MSTTRTIGICTGGGDAPGLNAVIRAAVKSAILKYKWKVIGIPDGFDGLIWPERSRELTLKDVSGILPRGGLSSAPPTAAIPSATRPPRTAKRSFATSPPT